MPSKRGEQGDGRRRDNGAGHIYQRGKTWWVKIHVNGKPIYQSSGSTKRKDAERLRDRLLGQRHRGEIFGGAPDKVTLGELLDDFLKNAKATVRDSTHYIYDKVVEANLRPYFGNLRAAKLTTKHLQEYRAKRLADKRSASTINRELALLRVALRLGQKCTPPKILNVPYFPMASEAGNVRKGFLSDEQYMAVLRELPDHLRAIFVVAYHTGVRLGELKRICWDQVDFTAGFINLNAGDTKSGTGRMVPILDGDMRIRLELAKKDRQVSFPNCQLVFSRAGEPIKDFRAAWQSACERAGVPDLRFHDLRRSAVRNMRRAGVPQVVRMKISGHKTDSMERRYSIVDDDDLKIAKNLMEARLKPAN